MSLAPVAPTEIIDPNYYQQYGYPFQHWDELRKNAPIAYCQHKSLVPFYAVTRYQDIVEISRQPMLYENAPLLVLQSRSAVESQDMRLRTLLNMDPPDHRTYRKLMSQYFTKNRLNELQPNLNDVANKLLDRLVDKDEIDFVSDVSMTLPLAVIAELLGLPSEDRDQFFKWTNEVIGSLDPDFARDDGTQGTELALKALGEVFEYCTKFVEQRRACPKDDLTSVLANAKIDGKHLEPLELLSYMFLLIAAGNETTRNATTGGMLALLEHPDQMAIALEQSDALDLAVEEIVRWTSPVIHFCRTPNQDVTLHGINIKAGEHLVLFYPSANRDDTIFQDPYRFNVLRQPNQQLGFGIGEHLCLGAHLARLELRAVFRGLFDRIEEAELTGEPSRLKSSIVGGIKHLPMKIKLKA
jgi:cytochrome P450